MDPEDRLYAYLEIENWQTKLLPMLICTITHVLKASNLAWENSFFLCGKQESYIGGFLLYL